MLASDHELLLKSVHAPGQFGKRPEDEADAALLNQLLSVAMLCNNASIVGGDPMEVALLRMAEDFHADRDRRIEQLPEVQEIAFDPDTKMMATVHRISDQEYLYAVKGAPESVFAVLAADQRPSNAAARWRPRADEMAKSGLRVLALAGKTAPSMSEAPYEGLVLYGLADPPREDVAESIERCQAAGVRVAMVTGDHAATALNIGIATGIVENDQATVVEGNELGEPQPTYPDAPIFARVTPAQKLGIINAFQERGGIVAMTGDGVNDARALKKADSGIAMGKRGSQVASEAADLILLDDRFSTIVGAMAQERVIFGNIRKFVIDLMSCNLSELLTIGVASFSGAPLPLLPLQILYLNLVTDVFPDFALGAGEGEPDVMRQGPRSAGGALACGPPLA